MSEVSIEDRELHSGETGLCALGVYLNALGFWEPFERLLHIRQKTVRYTPASKMRTLVCLFLAQGRHVVETNKRVRADTALCETFGCACCEQSVLQDTLSSCQCQNVTEFRAACAASLQRFGSVMRHPYSERPLVLDVDLTGATCGKGAEGAHKGYFCHKKNKTGRQVGRVIATEYDEVVCDAVEDGTQQLGAQVPVLLCRAVGILGIRDEQKQRTVIRLDGGGGTKDNVLWLTGEGYRFLVKTYSWRSAQAIMETVERWIEDPRTPGREVGFGTKPLRGYPDGVTFIAMRFKKEDGEYGGSALVTNLTGAQALALLSRPGPTDAKADAGLLAYVELYDLRGGGIETSFREDKQGLALDACNKKSMEAQRIVVAALSLAHNIVVWSRAWLSKAVEKVREFGIQRTVRDLLCMQGAVTIHVQQDEAAVPRRSYAFVFRERDPFAQILCHAFLPLFEPVLATLRLGQI